MKISNREQNDAVSEQLLFNDSLKSGILNLLHTVYVHWECGGSQFAQRQKLVGSLVKLAAAVCDNSYYRFFHGKSCGVGGGYKVC